MWAKAFFRRLAALTRKEFYQLQRDKSSMLLGIVMPVVLILLIYLIVRHRDKKRKKKQLSERKEKTENDEK